MDPIEYASTADEYAPLWRDAGRRLGHDAAKMRVLKREFLRALCVKDGGANGGMPAELDALWHEVVLNTKAYASICDRVCGHFVHHTTLSASDAWLERRSRVDDTVLRYRKRFREEPDEEVWQLEADGDREDSSSFRVVVKQINGKATTCDGVSGSTTIGRMKELVQKQTGIPQARQRLIYAGCVLEDRATCNDYGIQDSAMLHLAMRQSGC